MTRDKEIVCAEIAKQCGSGFVYLASPYSKLVATVGLDEAARVVALAAGAMIEEGIPVFSPIAHGHAVAEAYGLDKLDQDMWMKQCFPILSKASALVVLTFDGWHESAGVLAEIQAATFQKIPMMKVNPVELIPHHKYYAIA